MKIYYTDQFVLPLPPGHRFPMVKYRLLRERVAAAEWIARHELIVPHAATDEELCRAHDAEYVRRVSTGELTEREIRRLGFPWSPAMVERSRRSSGATIEACRAALADGAAVNLAGGTHHAFADAAEGFCVFNDSAVAARAMRAEGRARRVVVIDCDVHQGNGTAAIAADDPRIFTFSIHGAHNFPLRKQISDLDIELPDGAGDDDYLAALDRGLDEALNRADAELAIYLAGADPFKDDALGRLALTKPGLLARDQLVTRRCKAAGLPIAVTMAGGYARDIQDTVDIHSQTVEWLATQTSESVTSK